MLKKFTAIAVAFIMAIGLLPLGSMKVQAAESWLWPVPSINYASSPFGSPRPSPINPEYHEGIDIGCATGTKVVATKSGTVTCGKGSCRCGAGGAAGNHVTIRIDSQTIVRYLHLSQCNVDYNQSIKQGDTIGLSGATGNVTGAHLHFEIRSGNTNNAFCYGGNAINANPTDTTKGHYNSAGYGFSYSKALSYIYSISANSSPTAPTALSLSAGNIAVGDNITANWSGAAGVTSYTVSLINASTGATVSTLNNYKDTKAVFCPPSAGTYKISVSTNGNSALTKTSSNFTAHAPTTYTFKDWDGSVKKTVSVKYNSNISSNDYPVVTRDGYDFVTWQLDSSTHTYTAQYRIKTFTVTFKDQNGTTIQTGKVEYGKSATPPMSTNIPNGYEFFGWSSSDYKEVKSDLTIKQAVSWKNPNFLAAVSIENVSPSEDGLGYNFVVRLKGHPIMRARGKIILSLKTSDGSPEKMVASAVESFSMAAQPNSNNSNVICQHFYGQKISFQNDNNLKNFNVPLGGVKGKCTKALLSPLTPPSLAHFFVA